MVKKSSQKLARILQDCLHFGQIFAAASVFEDASPPRVAVSLSQAVAESTGMEPLRRPFRVCAESVFEKPKHLLGKEDSGNYCGYMVFGSNIL